MDYKDYNKIIELLSTKFNKVKHVEILKSVNIPNNKNTTNKLILLKKGKVVFGKGNKQIVLNPGDILFLPEFFLSPVTYGSQKAFVLDNNKFMNYKEQYLRFIDAPSIAPNQEVFSYISFQVKVHDVIDYFKFLDIPAFLIQDDAKFSNLVKNILVENASNHIGKQEVLTINTKLLVIMLIRHILNKKLFLEQIKLKVGILMDEHLATLFKYIGNNIDGDLSSIVLARELGVSKDYIGQYLKKRTKFNLQEYIGQKRLEKAIKLVENTNMKIDEISKACGFKKISYFCKKFKDRWNINALKMRSRSSIDS